MLLLLQHVLLHLPLSLAKLCVEFFLLRQLGVGAVTVASWRGRRKLGAQMDWNHVAKKGNAAFDA